MDAIVTSVMESSERTFVREYLNDSLHVIRAFVASHNTLNILESFASQITIALSNGHKLLIAGNGGSAGDAQHIAGEFVSRLFLERAPLPAIALTTDTSVLTAIGNDYGYEKVFERQVLGLGVRGDVFWGISTSGKSPNVLRALEAARSRGLMTLGFTGAAGGRMAELCDYLLCAPSRDTAQIQQIHIIAAHSVCALVERRMFATQGASEIA